MNMDLADTSMQTVHEYMGQASLRLTLWSSTGVENAIGSEYSDAIAGNSRSNVLRGRDGHDVLTGLAGNDVLYGDNGNDDLHTGAGANQAFDGEGNDTVNFSQNAVGISFHASNGDDVVYGTVFADSI
jgi:Ca2+-binding RTX toxin-like protein